MKRTIQRTAALVLGLLLGVSAWAGLETGTYISDLNASWPLGSDLASTSDDHIRLVKTTIKNTFPNVNAAVTGTPTQLNNLTGSFQLSGGNWSTSNSITANSFIPTSSTVPANGIYLPSANTVGFSSASTARGNVNASGNWTLNAPTSGSSAALGITNTSTLPNLDLNNTNTAIGNPILRLINASASAQTAVDFFTNGTISGRLRNDFAGGMSYIGFSSGEHDFYTGGDNGAGTIRFTIKGSAPYVQGWGSAAGALVDMSPDTTTATGTLTGCTTSPTTTVRLSRTGNVVVVSIDGTVTCTSNATSFTLTGAIPSSFQPARQQVAAIPGLADASVNGSANAAVMSGSSTITFSKVSGTFTASGVKGFIYDGTAFSYQLK